MASPKSNYVVIIEQTYNNGTVYAEVQAKDSCDALDQAYEIFDIDPDRTSKFVRDSWVIRGELC